MLNDRVRFLYLPQKQILINKCYYCEIDFVSKPIQPLSKTRDHIIPVSKGGRNCTENIVYACSACNKEKSDKLPEQYLEYLKGRRSPSAIKIRNTSGLIETILPYRSTLFKKNYKPTPKQIIQQAISPSKNIAEILNDWQKEPEPNFHY